MCFCFAVCPVPMNKEEEEFIKERERNRELMEEIAREIEMTCLGRLTRYRIVEIIYKDTEQTDPFGTHAGQVHVVDSTPGSLTCCVLPWRKLCIHCHKDLLMFLPLSLDKRIE